MCFEATFSAMLKALADSGDLRPVFEYKAHPFYSTFQIYQIFLINFRDSTNISSGLRDQLTKFEKLLTLLLEIQDVYLPEVRGNLRTGLWLDYAGSKVLSGTFFCNRTTYLLSALRSHQKQLIADSDFDPGSVLEESALSHDEVRG